jgi:tRNA(Arg) A34 adenosine deaminase TadA
MAQRGFTVTLPDWLAARHAATACIAGDDEARMTYVVALAARNVAIGTGGPFGAAVFEQATGRVLGVGVNLVVSARCSAAHAEIVAISMAQQALGTHQLGGPGIPALELVTSAEPCAMCLGALPWSGVQRLVCGARDADVRAVKFDEGDKPADWVAGLARRGIEVRRDVCRAAAVRVLHDYIAAGGPVYNG